MLHGAKKPSDTFKWESLSSDPPLSFDASGNLNAATLGACPMPDPWLWGSRNSRIQQQAFSHHKFPKEIIFVDILNCSIFEFPKYLVFNATSKKLKKNENKKKNLKVHVRTWIWAALMGNVSGGVLLLWSCTSQDSVFGYQTPNTEMP